SSLDVTRGFVTVLADGTSNGASRVQTLSINTPNGASFDLNDNDLIVGSGTYGDIRSLISIGRHGGAWDLGGITSSAARTATPKNKMLGVLTGSQLLSTGVTSFDGFAVAPTDTLV